MRAILIIYWIWYMLATYMLTSDFVTYFPYDSDNQEFKAMVYVKIFDLLSFAFIALAPPIRFAYYKDRNAMYWQKLCWFCCGLKFVFILAAILKYPKYGQFFAITLFVVIMCHLCFLVAKRISDDVGNSWFRKY